MLAGANSVLGRLLWVHPKKYTAIIIIIMIIIYIIFIHFMYLYGYLKTLKCSIYLSIITFLYQNLRCPILPVAPVNWDEAINSVFDWCLCFLLYIAVRRLKSIVGWLRKFSHNANFQKVSYFNYNHLTCLYNRLNIFGPISLLFFLINSLHLPLLHTLSLYNYSIVFYLYAISEIYRPIHALSCFSKFYTMKIIFF